MRAMDPMLHKWTPRGLQTRAFTLRDFVLVMRKRQVFSAHVQVEARSENFHAHGAALDVPPGPPVAPGARPENLAVLWHPRLPQREIGERFLAIFIGLDPLPAPHLLEIQIHQLPIAAP